MNDLNIQHVEHMSITPASNRRFQPPRLLIKSQHFAAGYTTGFSSAINADLSRDEMLTDEDIIESIKMIFFEEGMPTPTENEVAEAIGSLVGEILARS